MTNADGKPASDFMSIELHEITGAESKRLNLMPALAKRVTHVTHSFTIVGDGWWNEKPFVIAGLERFETTPIRIQQQDGHWFIALPNREHSPIEPFSMMEIEAALDQAADNKNMEAVVINTTRACLQQSNAEACVNARRSTSVIELTLDDGTTLPITIHYSNGC